MIDPAGSTVDGPVYGSLKPLHNFRQRKLLTACANQVVVIAHQYKCVGSELKSIVYIPQVLSEYFPTVLDREIKPLFVIRASDDMIRKLIGDD